LLGAVASFFLLFSFLPKLFLRYRTAFFIFSKGQQNFTVNLTKENKTSAVQFSLLPLFCFSFKFQKQWISPSLTLVVLLLLAVFAFCFLYYLFLRKICSIFLAKI
jgi:uncharacterized membrane protein YobD (UPF0266 family)